MGVVGTGVGGLPAQTKLPAFLYRSVVISDSCVPPPTFSIRVIGREVHGKSTLAVVFSLEPHALPCMIR